MYIVVSYQVTKARLPGNIVRAISGEPIKALEMARTIQKEDEDEVQDILIFSFEPDRLYSFRELWLPAREELHGNLMYRAWQDTYDEPWREKWNEEFRKLVNEPIPA